MKTMYIASLGLLALTACSSGSVKNTLGLERSAPDEFRVISRPPLSVPPQFALRPPSNNDVSPNQLPADMKARSIINGNNPTPPANGSLPADTAVIPVTQSKSVSKRGVASGNDPIATSGAESQFLKNAGASNADPKVRDVLVEEKYAVQEKKEERAWWDILSAEPEKKDPQVDAKKESDRLKKNVDEGKPVTEGETPEVKPKNEGLLNSILQ